ncbi:MAG: hypothetical protein AAFO07_06450 [Bacteroidota bacterium]
MIQNKLIAIICTLLLLGAILAPITENWKAKPKDDFPLSYYPMFSHKRGETYSLRYIVGYDANGERYKIPYKIIGTGGFNQVRRQINKWSKRGEGQVLLTQVADRIVNYEKKPYSDLVRLQLVKGTYHFDTYFLTDDKSPIKEKIISEKKIDRP